MIDERAPVVILGAGPAGLAAAVELARAGRQVVVIERGRAVGGLARTEVYKGFRFDIGGHRFYTKSEEIQRFWSEALGGDFLLRPRLSRIYYRGRFFRYPLQAWDTLTGLGPLEAARAFSSYLRRWAMPLPPEDTFERWVVNRFGERLYETFFKSYTEKVWGVPCSELRGEWAAQRLKDLSLGAVLVRAMGLSGNGARSMIEEFHYPRLGPGMLWEAVQALAETAGARFRLGAEVVGIERDGGSVRAVMIRDAAGLERIEASEIISSIPLRPFVSMLDAPAPEDVRRAASGLRHRDYLTVCLILRRRELFPDNWIYVHDPKVRVARIQNFKNWSPDMVPDADKTSLGLEFFCREGDCHLEPERRGARGARDARARRDRAGAPRRRGGRLRLPREPRLSHLRCQLPGAARVRQGVPGRARQLPDDRAQRAAPLQQPGPRRALRPARRAQRAFGTAPLRRLEHRQRRGLLRRGQGAACRG